MNARAREIAEALSLAPHPEGGLFVETYRSPRRLDGLAGGPRPALTAINFLLVEGAFSAFHRVTSDEVWSLEEGDGVRLHVLDDEGRHQVALLGRDYAQGSRPHAVVRAGSWQAAEPLGPYALCGCFVAPGFDYADFELADRNRLCARFPEHAALIARLSLAPSAEK